MLCVQSMYNSKLKHYTYIQSQLNSDFISKWIHLKQFQLYHKYNGNISYYTFLISYLKPDEKTHMKQMCMKCTCCSRHQKHKHHLYKQYTHDESTECSKYKIENSCLCFCSCRHLYRDILRCEEIEQYDSIVNHPEYPSIRYIERKREKWIERYFSIELYNNNNKLHLCHKELNNVFNRRYKQGKTSDEDRLYYDYCKKNVLYYQRKVDRLLSQDSAMYHYFLACNSIEYNVIDIDSDEDYDDMYDWSEDDNESYS